MDIALEIEPLRTRAEGDRTIVNLPECTAEERETVNPLVPPTSGLRMLLLDKKDENAYVMPARRHALFLRVFKAISEVLGEKQGQPLHILLVSDERPTAPHLLEESARIFLADGHRVYFQEPGAKFRSPLSTPYASASLSLFDELDVVVVVTASHNSIVWNGIKFYYQLPIPISGDLMRAISERALSYAELPMLAALPDDVPHLPAEARNNEYIRQLLGRILEMKALRGQKVVLWPFMGPATGIVSLLNQLGAEVVLIDREVDPPDPTEMTAEHEQLVISNLQESGAKLAILLDADRDRIVFLLEQGGQYQTLSPNELYTAMHNVLSRDMDNAILNVRTVPSDPRGDEESVASYITGVGYKHLGVILYLLSHQLEDESKFETGILYYKAGAEFVQIDEHAKAFAPLEQLVEEEKLAPGEELVAVLWEESGGHTFNLLKLEQVDPLQFSSPFPLIGDKYPAPAICVLTELINRGYDLSEYIDQSIVSYRDEIHASDREKLAIMDQFTDLVGKELAFGEYHYKVFSFTENTGKLEIIGLRSDHSVLYFRPSGTGPLIRIYIFGDKARYRDEIETVQRGIDERFR